METTPTYTKKISYSKEFLSGTLEGLSVRSSIQTVDDAVHLHMESLNAYTKANPGIDVSGAYFWVYNLGCEDIAVEVVA